MDALNALVYTTNPWYIFAIGYAAGGVFAFATLALGTRHDD